jgi:hypothetical protein
VSQDSQTDPLAPPEGYGQPRRAPGPEEGDLSRCAFPLCAHPLAWLITLGDLQEHVFRMAWCRCHAEIIFTRPNRCTTCAQSGSGSGWRRPDTALHRIEREEISAVADCPHQRVQVEDRISAFFSSQGTVS